MPASPSSLIASLSTAPAGLSTPQLAASLSTALAQVPDPRARRGIRHRLAAADQHTGVVLASTDVDTKTNDITRFAQLLDHVDLRDVVVTADALHCQREHVTYLARRGTHWILTVKGNQPSLHQQLAG